MRTRRRKNPDFTTVRLRGKYGGSGGEYYADPGDKRMLSRIKKDLESYRKEEPSFDWYLETRGSERGWHRANESDLFAGVQNNPGCKACGGQLVKLGGLGNLMHYRCRDCGMDSSRKVAVRWRRPKPKQSVQNPRARRYRLSSRMQRILGRNPRSRRILGSTWYPSKAGKFKYASLTRKSRRNGRRYRKGAR